MVNIGDINDFYKLIRILAAYSAKILNLSELSGISGIPVNTLKRWISILEASYIVFLLRPYFKNISKRYIKSPKIYFYDTGLVSYLTGISTKTAYEKGIMYGEIFENYIISEIIKNNFHKALNRNYYYYRTSGGNEIDLIEEDKNRQKYLEIKTSFTLKSGFLKNLLAEKPESKPGVLLYNGTSKKYSDNIEITNYKEYLSKI